MLCSLAALLATGCGRKGPPLPPLVKLPAAPADLIAERRGDTVALRFTVPSANTDNTRPANVARVDVYAFTGPAGVSDADLFRYGTKVASVAVKSPRDPEKTIEADELEEEAEPLEGMGLDQGAVAHIDETLTAAAARAGQRPASPSDEGRGKQRADPLPYELGRPLLGPPPATETARTYVGVGVTRKGRRGQLSRRVVVPLVPPPAPPMRPEATYTETAITLTWGPSPSAVPAPADPGGGVLPSRPIGMTPSRILYDVYEIPVPAVPPGRPAPPSAPTDDGTRLTTMPVADTEFTDARVAWGATRCYAVRTVEVLDALPIVSGPTPSVCVTPVDTFPPAPPRGLNAVAGGEGAINLIWDANAEADLDGYLVLRAVAPGEALEPLTPAPIHETTFRDRVEPGTRYVYALAAVDKAGNTSRPSERVEETAR